MQPVAEVYVPVSQVPDFKFGLPMFNDRFFRVGTAAWISALCLCVVIGTSLPGCSKKTPPSETSDGDDSEGDQAKSEGTDDHKATSHSKSKKPAKGPEIGGIPVDVWPEVWLKDPLDVAANKASVSSPAAAAPAVASTAGAKTPAAAAAPPPEAKPAADAGAAKPAAGGGKDDGWKALISGEDITDETKAIKLKLTDALSTVGKYNGNYKDVIQVDAAELSALASIAITHPDAVGWKENAKFIRDLSSEVASKAKGLGQKDYDAAKVPFEKLNDLLSGNKPAGLEEAAPEIAFSELFSRKPVMKRMDRAYQFLKAGVNNEATFKKEAEKVKREATVLGVLAKISGAEGYPSTDEEDYQKFVKTAVTACQDMVAAVKNENFGAFTDALGRCQKTCDECHPSYRTNN